MNLLVTPQKPESLLCSHLLWKGFHAGNSGVSTNQCVLKQALSEQNVSTGNFGPDLKRLETRLSVAVIHQMPKRLCYTLSYSS